MKRIPVYLWIVLFAAGFLPGTAMAQQIGYNVPMQIGESYVLIDADGVERVPPGAYSLITSISPPNAPAEEELFCAVPIDESGRNCALLTARGEALTDAEYQYFLYENDLITFMRDGLYGVMDKELNVVIPCAYTSIVSNGEGGYLALTSDPYDERPDGVYYVKPNGEEIPTGIRIIYGLNSFSQGLMPVISADNNKYGYVNAQGEWAIPPQFWYGDNFYQGRATASVESGTGMIDRNGNWMLTPKYRNISVNLPGGDIILVTTGSASIQLIDPATYQTKKVFQGEEELYCNTAYDNNVAVLYDMQTVRLIDADGDVLMTEKSDVSYETWGGMGDRVVVQRGLPGEMASYLYTLEGGQIFGPAQEVWLLGKCGEKNAYAYALYDVETQTESMVNWEGMWEIEGTRMMGVIDEDGQSMIPPHAYRMITYIGDGVFMAHMADKIAVIDDKGNELIAYSIPEKQE